MNEDKLPASALFHDVRFKVTVTHEDGTIEDLPISSIKYDGSSYTIRINKSIYKLARGEKHDV